MGIELQLIVIKKCYPIALIFAFVPDNFLEQ